MEDAEEFLTVIGLALFIGVSPIVVLEIIEAIKEAK